MVKKCSFILTCLVASIMQTAHAAVPTLLYNSTCTLGTEWVGDKVVYTKKKLGLTGYSAPNLLIPGYFSSVTSNFFYNTFYGNETYNIPLSSAKTDTQFDRQSVVGHFVDPTSAIFQSTTNGRYRYIVKSTHELRKGTATSYTVIDSKTSYASCNSY